MDISTSISYNIFTEITNEEGTVMNVLTFRKHSEADSKASFHRMRYILIYTLAFLVLASLAFSPFWLNGKSLIWKPDGLTQHFNSLVYFGNWGRSILHTLVTEHRLVVPLWDSTIGYGSDILTTLHYYVIGDPLNLLAIFIPVRYMETLYNGLILFRMYLAGISFSCYCFYLKRDPVSVLAGALAYAFCGYALVLAPMHPYFINPMIYLPLLLLGVEKVFHKESGHLLIAMTALSSISNFYFFYMLVILVVIYCVIRFCTMKHTNWGKEWFAAVSRTLFFSLTGVAVSAFMLLPILLQFLSDDRSNSSLTYAASYGLDYYEQFADQFVSLTYSSNWTYLGFTSIALLCVFLLFLKKKQFPAFKIGFLFLTAMLLIPAAGSLMNGFSYPANRWSFGYAFLVSVILTFLWPDLQRLSSREKAGILLLTFLYLITLLFLHHTGSNSAFFSLGLMLLAVLFVSEASGILSFLTSPVIRTRVMHTILLSLLAVGIIGNSISFYRINPDGHLGRFVDSGKGLAALEETASGMMSLFLTDDTEFFRSAQEPVPVRNDSLNHNTHTIHYYWSLSNGSITRFFNELALPFKERAFKYSSLDYRSSLHALATVRYYVRHNPNDYVPYPYTGFEPYEYLDDLYFISETDDYLPFGFACKQKISRETYEALPYLQRQQALLQGVVCDDSSGAFTEAELSFTEQEIPYEISFDSDILELNGIYYALEENAKLTLTFKSIEGCETYLLMEGVNARSMTDMNFLHHETLSVFFQEDWEEFSQYQKRQKKLTDLFDSGISRFPFTCSSDVVETEFAYYAGVTESSYDRSDYLINMGYAADSQTSITITLPYQGAYSFRNLSVLCLPVQNLSEQLSSLSQEHMEQVRFRVNQISGTISLSENRLVFLSIPYSSGWSAYVDGVQTPVLQADTMYMALPVDAGTHTIELRYMTPGLRDGIKISALGLGAWLLYLLFYIYGTVRKKKTSSLS